LKPFFNTFNYLKLFALATKICRDILKSACYVFKYKNIHVDLYLYVSHANLLTFNLFKLTLLFLSAVKNTKGLKTKSRMGIIINNFLRSFIKETHTIKTVSK